MLKYINSILKHTQYKIRFLHALPFGIMKIKKSIFK